MKKPPHLIPFLALGLLSHSASAVVSFGGYDWFDGSAATELVGDTMVSNLGSSSSTWTVYLRPDYDPIILDEAGETMVITWKFKLTNVNVSNTSQNFRIGIMDSPDDTRVTTDNAPSSGAYTGYALFANMGQITDNSGAFQIRERNAEGSTLGTSSLWDAQDTGMGKGMLGYADDIEYTFTASIERTDNGSAQVDFMMTGGSVNDTGSVTVSFLDGTPQPFIYDTFMIRPSNATTTADTFTTTAFTVTAPAGTGLLKGPGYMGNYDVVIGTDGQQWVDTGAWLGWVNVENYPVIFVLGVNSWTYIADASKTGDKDATGAWTYMFR